MGRRQTQRKGIENAIIALVQAAEAFPAVELHRIHIKKIGLHLRHALFTEPAAILIWSSRPK